MLSERRLVGKRVHERFAAQSQLRVASKRDREGRSKNVVLGHPIMALHHSLATCGCECLVLRIPGTIFAENSECRYYPSHPLVTECPERYDSVLAVSMQLPHCWLMTQRPRAVHNSLYSVIGLSPHQETVDLVLRTFRSIITRLVDYCLAKQAPHVVVAAFLVVFVVLYLFFCCVVIFVVFICCFLLLLLLLLSLNST